MNRTAFRGDALVDGRLRRSVVDVEDGLIVSIGEGDSGEAERTIDLADDEVLLPAAVDLLAAARDWNEWERDTIETATRAALAGGITTLCDQPNTQPRITSPELVAERVKSFEASSYVDFGIQAHPPHADPSSAFALREAGAFGLTYFQWDLPPWNYPRDIDDSRQRMEIYRAAGLQAMFILDELALRETPLEAEAETYAVQHFLRRLDPELDARAFVTLANSVELLSAAKEQFPRLTLQIAPHYLLMPLELAERRIGIASGHSPPLRSAENCERLQLMARDGLFDIFVSHHTPHRVPDKHSSSPIPGEFAPKRGFTSIDFAFPLMLTRLGIERTCQGFCANPAERLGIRKGSIRLGFEADLVVARRKDSIIDPSHFESKGKVTPFVGDRMAWQIARTYLRGTQVFDVDDRTFVKTEVRRVA